jgi:fatty-acyl-CoA synthase
MSRATAARVYSRGALTPGRSPATLGHVLARHARVRGGHPAVVTGATSTSFELLNTRVNRLANVLAGRGVGRGDRVAMLLPNRVEVWDLLFACAKLGAVMATVNDRLSPAEVQLLIADADPRLVVTTADLAGRLLEPDGALLVGPDYEAALSGADDAEPSAEVVSDDPVLITFTSGTTGSPKGVVLSHGNVLATCVNEVLEWGIGPADSTVTVAPLFHIGGLLAFTFPCLHAGGTVHVVDALDLDAALAAIERDRVSLVFLPPSLWRRLAHDPRLESANLSSVRLCVSGGESLAEQDVRLLRAAFGAELDEAYGLSEAASCSAVLRGDDVFRKPGSLGRPFPHNLIRIAGPDGRELPPGEIGEIVQAGPSVMLGYWRRPEETAEALAGGWLHTGDLGYADEEGFLFLAARQKDMFVSGGWKIYPAEIERVLRGHPALADAAVFGVPDEAAGEIVAAAVVPRPGADVRTEEILEFCVGRVADFKLPRLVVVADELPRNSSGKVVRSDLRATHQRALAR